ncbi:hypothetical protein STEG23_037012, partial [Scotinomys teguina]
MTAAPCDTDSSRSEWTKRYGFELRILATFLTDLCAYNPRFHCPPAFRQLTSHSNSLQGKVSHGEPSEYTKQSRATDFFELTLYPATLLKVFISCRSSLDKAYLIMVYNVFDMFLRNLSISSRFSNFVEYRFFEDPPNIWLHLSLCICFYQLLCEASLTTVGLRTI